jgi:hypothetical protein
MGIYLCGSRNSYDHPPEKTTETSSSPPLPDPRNYKIKKYLEIDNNLLIEIQYLDCTNYEGNKILLYKDISLELLKSQVLIDPHFSENSKYRSPAARFEPTDAGWKMGIGCLHCEFWFN